ncbi:unnamed protein product, partial [Polarella glacialis]
ISRQMLLELESDPSNHRLADALQLMHGVGRTMQLLLQFLTLDSYNIRMELIMEFVPWSFLFFYSYISIAVFVLMNLVTAIIVEGAMSSSRIDEDVKLKQMAAEKMKELGELQCLFGKMDTDGSGTIDWDEFEAAFQDEGMSRKWRLLDYHVEDVKELFELLDDDGDIETSEFFSGLARLKGSAQSRDLMRVSKTVERLSKTLERLYNFVGGEAGIPPSPKRGQSQAGPFD